MDFYDFHRFYSVWEGNFKADGLRTSAIGGGSLHHNQTIFIIIIISSSGADMDVCLMNYGHCNYVSGKHACIFYDEVTDANALVSDLVPVKNNKV